MEVLFWLLLLLVRLGKRGEQTDDLQERTKQTLASWSFSVKKLIQDTRKQNDASVRQFNFRDGTYRAK